jgi:hypothetical protein
MMDAEMERELKRLKDIEAIVRLRSLYCYYADLKDCDNWANLFTEDGVFETDVFGVYEGRETIRALQHLPFAVHYVANPIIDVDGDRATGRWLLFEPCSFPVGKQSQPVWGMAKYEDQYERVGGEWKFKRVKLMSHSWAPYEKGWEKERIICQGAAKARPKAKPKAARKATKKKAKRR